MLHPDWPSSAVSALCMARPGIILYGFDPSDEVRFGKFRPVMKLKTVVSMVKELQPGQSTSYGRRFTAETPTRVATLCTGYADGYPRLLSCGKGIIEVHGVPCPVLGRVCMDQLMVDVTAVPDVQEGDEAILWGGTVSDSAEDIARNRTEAETDRKVEATLKQDAAAGMKLLADLVNQSKIAAAQARAEFDQAMKDATADGDISDEEKDRIKKAQDAYSLAEGLVDRYAAKLRSAQDETQKRAGAVKPQGTFYAKAASALRGNMMEQRMFMATQEIEKHTKKAAELLKDMGGGNTQTFQ